MRLVSLLLCVASIVLAQGVQAQEAEPIGDWYYLASQDPMTDADRSAAFVPTSDMDLAFGVKCMSSGPQAIVLLQSAMDQLNMISMDEAGQVQYRFDDRAPVGPDEWRYESDPGALIAPSGHTRRIIQRSREHREVAVRVFNADGEEVRTEILSLMGATRALSRLTCVK